MISTKLIGILTACMLVIGGLPVLDIPQNTEPDGLYLPSIEGIEENSQGYGPNALGIDDIEEMHNLEITAEGDIQLDKQEETAPDANTVVLYDFDEDSGDVVYDKGPNQIHGQITNPIWVEGKYNGGLLLQNQGEFGNDSAIVGDLNLNPSSSPNNRFEMQTPFGLIDIDTLHTHGSGYSYNGTATEIRIKPKAQGRTLVLNGQTIQLAPNRRYTVTSSSMTVYLRNTQGGAKWNQAKGHWWIDICAANATIIPFPAPSEVERHYVLLGNNSAFDIENEITIEAWVNPSIVCTAHPIIMKSEAYSLELVPGSQDCYLRGALFIDGSWRFIEDDTTPIIIGDWTHVALAYDSVNMSLYIDNQLVSTRPHMGAINVNSNPVYIGRNTESDAYYCGIIDEVRISDKAFTDFDHIWHTYFREGYLITTQTDLPLGMMWGYCALAGSLLEHIDLEALTPNGQTILTIPSVYTVGDLSAIDPVQYPSIKLKFTLLRHEFETPVLSNYTVGHVYSIDPWIYFDIDNTHEVVITARSLVVEQQQIVTTTTVILDTPSERIVHYRFEDTIGSVEMTVQINYLGNVTDIRILDLKHNSDPPQVQDENLIRFDYTLTPTGDIETLGMDIATSDFSGNVQSDYIGRYTHVLFPDLWGPLAAQFEEAIAYGYVPTYWVFYLYQIWKDHPDMNQRGPLYWCFSSPWADSYDSDGVCNFVEYMFGIWDVAIQDPKWAFDSERELKNPSNQGYYIDRDENNKTETGIIELDSNGNGKVDLNEFEIIGDGWSDYKEIYLTRTLPSVINKRWLMLVGGGGNKDNNDPRFWNTLNNIYKTFVGKPGEVRPFTSVTDGGPEVISKMNGVLILYANGELPGDADDPRWDGDLTTGSWGNGSDGDNMHGYEISNNIPWKYQPRKDQSGAYLETIPIRSVIGTGRNETGYSNITIGLEFISQQLVRGDFLWIMVAAHGFSNGFGIWGSQYTYSGSKDFKDGLDYFKNTGTKVITMIGSCNSAGVLTYGLAGKDRIFLTSSKNTEKSYICDGLTISGTNCSGTTYPFDEPGNGTTDFHEVELFYHFVNCWAGQDWRLLGGVISTPANEDQSPAGRDKDVRGDGKKRRDKGWRDMYGTKLLTDRIDISLLEAFNFVSAMESHHPMYTVQQNTQKYSTPCLEDDGDSDYGTVSLTYNPSDGKYYYNFLPDASTGNGYVSNHIYL
ncbi:MAG: LamG domain-containing protein [Thermoplasmata archaeon]|nr:MAG: LamG domain-containing protein [Thermoplasmata archaeon]